MDKIIKLIAILTATTTLGFCSSYDNCMEDALLPVRQHVQQSLNHTTPTTDLIDPNANLRQFLNDVNKLNLAYESYLRGLLEDVTYEVEVVTKDRDILRDERDVALTQAMDLRAQIEALKLEGDELTAEIISLNQEHHVVRGYIAASTRYLRK